MSSSYTTLGVNENNQIPYLAGDDNIINLTIDPPISVDLSSFNTGQSNPYISGNGNVITISIGDDSYAFTNATRSAGGTVLTFTRLGGDSVTVNLPNVVTKIERENNDLIITHASGFQETVVASLWSQDIVKEIDYSAGSNSMSVKFENNEIINYNIVYNDDGTISKIVLPSS